MALEDLTFRLVIILAPGIVATGLVTRLTPGKGPEPFFFMMSSAALGLLSYAGVFGIHVLARLVGRWQGWAVQPLKMGGYLFDDAVPIAGEEVAMAAAVGVLVGLVLSIIINSNWFFERARKLGITAQSGYNGIWTMLLKRVPNSNWAILRDRTSGDYFEGWIHLYSDDTDPAEIFLRDVYAFDKDGRILYRTPAAFFALDSEKHHLEFPKVEEGRHYSRYEASHGK